MRAVPFDTALFYAANFINHPEKTFTWDVSFSG